MNYDSAEDNRRLLRAIIEREDRNKKADAKRETLEWLAEMTAEMIRRQSQKLGS